MTRQHRLLIVAALFGLMIAPAQAATLHTLYQFQSNQPIGAVPAGGVVLDAAGNLYGSTRFYGTTNWGSVYRFTPGVGMTSLHDYTPATGTVPYPGLTRDGAGNLYGTSFSGGQYGVGTVFRVSAAGVHTVLHNFNDATSVAYNPVGGVVRDGSGNLYGAANAGIYRLTAGGQFTLLHLFTGSNGQNPTSTPIIDPAGNLIGTANMGGSFPAQGVIYSLSPGGTYTALHTFGQVAGAAANPYAGVIADAAGNLYGTTQNGGSAGFGTVFRWSPTAGLTILHNFDGTTGRNPMGGLIRDAAGNLFGTARQGGDNGTNLGTVFRIAANGSFSTLHSFSGPDGAWPEAALVADAAGNLFGTTSNGSGNFGTIFRISDAGFVPGSAVPEPASWLMLVTGFGLAGLALRRRHQARPAAGSQPVDRL